MVWRRGWGELVVWVGTLVIVGGLAVFGHQQAHSFVEAPPPTQRRIKFIHSEGITPWGYPDNIGIIHVDGHDVLVTDHWALHAPGCAQRDGVK